MCHYKNTIAFTFKMGNCSYDPIEIILLVFSFSYRLTLSMGCSQSKQKREADNDFQHIHTLRRIEMTEQRSIDFVEFPCLLACLLAVCGCVIVKPSFIPSSSGQDHSYTCVGFMPPVGVELLYPILKTCVYILPNSVELSYS